MASQRTHHLLGHEDLRRGNLDSEVTTGDHDTVGDGENLVKVDDTLLVLDLDDDLDAGALGTEDLADREDVLGRADEGGKDHVDAVLDAKLEVLLVLLGQGREVDRRLGEVDTLARTERAVVDGLDLEPVALDGEDLQREDAVVDIDVLAGRRDLGEVLLQRAPRQTRVSGGPSEWASESEANARSPCRSARPSPTRRQPGWSRCRIRGRPES